MQSTTVRSVLLVFDDPEKAAALCTIYEAAAWHVRAVATVQEAVLAVERNSIAVLVTEYTLSDGSWRKIVSALRRSSTNAAILVTSPIADEHMWAEILNVGGFDMILQPFEPEEVIRISACACRDTAGERGRRNVFAA